MFACIFATHPPIAPPLTAPYNGPYKVVTRSGRVFKVLIKGKVETLTADLVKPAHIERTPESERTRQPKATPTLKPTALQPTASLRRSCRQTKHYYVEAFQNQSLHEAKFERTVYVKDKGKSSRG